MAPGNIPSGAPDVPNGVSGGNQSITSDDVPTDVPGNAASYLTAAGHCSMASQVKMLPPPPVMLLLEPVRSDTRKFLGFLLGFSLGNRSRFLCWAFV